MKKLFTVMIWVMLILGVLMIAVGVNQLDIMLAIAGLLMTLFVGVYALAKLDYYG